MVRLNTRHSLILAGLTVTLLQTFTEGMLNTNCHVYISPRNITYVLNE